MFNIRCRLQIHGLSYWGVQGFFSLCHNINVKKTIQQHLGRERKGEKTRRSNWGHIHWAHRHFQNSVQVSHRQHEWKEGGKWWSRTHVAFLSFSGRTRKVITHCLSKHPWHHLVYSQRNPKKGFFILTLISAVLVPTLCIIRGLDRKSVV